MQSRSIDPRHVVWRVHPELDLIQASGFLTGLAELVRKRVVSLSVEYVDTPLKYAAALDFRFTAPGIGAGIDVIVDFGDREERIDYGALSVIAPTKLAS